LKEEKIKKKQQKEGTENTLVAKRGSKKITKKTLKEEVVFDKG
jgi:hypothetical protein